MWNLQYLSYVIARIGHHKGGVSEQYNVIDKTWQKRQ